MEIEEKGSERTALVIFIILSILLGIFLSYVIYDENRKEQGMREKLETIQPHTEEWCKTRWYDNIRMEDTCMIDILNDKIKELEKSKTENENGIAK